MSWEKPEHKDLSISFSVHSWLAHFKMNPEYASNKEGTEGEMTNDAAFPSNKMFSVGSVVKV